MLLKFYDDRRRLTAAPPFSGDGEWRRVRPPPENVFLGFTQFVDTNNFRVDKFWKLCHLDIVK